MDKVVSQAIVLIDQGRSFIIFHWAAIGESLNLIAAKFVERLYFAYSFSAFSSGDYAIAPS